jgi:hypothetical protein
MCHGDSFPRTTYTYITKRDNGGTDMKLNEICRFKPVRLVQRYSRNTQFEFRQAHIPETPHANG